VPNKRSAEKMMRVAERRRLRNRSVKSAVKTFIRKAETGISAGSEDVQALVVQAVRSLDKAARKGILHPGNAARRKSRLMKKRNVAAATPAQPAEAAPARRATRATTRPRATRKA
jgi:small subunit ribosomal protein S20